MLVQMGYQTELNPTNVQRTMLLKNAGAARFTYNWALNQKKLAMNAKTKPTFRTSDPSFLRIFILSSDNTMWMRCGNGRTSAGARSGGLSIPATRGYRT